MLDLTRTGQVTEEGRLAYQSQCYSPRDRALTQAGKIRRKLGGAEGIAWDFPEKPPRRRWRTYERLRDRCNRYEEIYDSGTWAVIQRILARAYYSAFEGVAFKAC